MKKPKPKFKWICMNPGKGDDDYYAKWGKYMLRAEQMNKRRWWWCVYYKDETIAADYMSKSRTDADTLQKAKFRARIHAIRHYYRNKKEKV